MIELPFFSGLPVAVFGLGRSGLSAARALRDSGAEVWAWDDSEERRNAARQENLEIVNLNHCGWRELTTLVISPGIPSRLPEPHPIARLARDHNCEIIGDIELLGRAQHNASYIGITGTNGKSTTTALIGHILQLSGRTAAIGGNLGIPALDLDALRSGEFYVIEMSSYQLELTFSITFDVAVLLNVSPDHLERHGGMAGYIAAKRQIFNRQTRPRTAVIGIDDEYCEKICSELREAGDQVVIPISGSREIAGGVYAKSGILYDDTENQKVSILDLREVASLPGAHNWQNAAAAYAACKAVGVDAPVIAACIRSFPGLAHRQQVVAIVNGVAYVNDSKATNIDAATKALSCYGLIYWIAGGRPKDQAAASLVQACRNVRHAFLIGEAEELFAKALDGDVPYTRCATLERALAAAAAMAEQAKSGCAVVLLSPGCSSFDQYRDFEARGEAFCTAVDALPGARQAADSFDSRFLAPDALGGTLQ